MRGEKRESERLALTTLLPFPSKMLLPFSLLFKVCEFRRAT